jgi:inorganic triphosphatase YgiF
MVKTRQQQKQATHQQQSQSSSNHVCGVQTRSGARKLERVELPAIVLSKEMNKRHQIKKAIAKRSKEIQTDRKIKKLVKYSKQFKAHHKQTNHEMLAVWKNLDSAFKLIDGLCKFRDRVEGRC